MNLLPDSLHRPRVFGGALLALAVAAPLAFAQTGAQPGTQPGGSVNQTTQPGYGTATTSPAPAVGGMQRNGTGTSPAMGNGGTMPKGSGTHTMPDGTVMRNDAMPASKPMDGRNMPRSTGGDMATTKADRMFFKKAAQSGMLETQAGEVASDKARAEELKDYGRMMVSEHTDANQKLMAIAGSHGVELPAALDKEHGAKLRNLKNTKAGNAFDMAYTKEMVMGHKKTVALFEAAASGPTSPDVKQFATDTLPTLRKHTEMITAIQAKMKSGA